MDSLIGPRHTVGQQAGSAHKEKGMFNLPAPQTTTTCLLLSLISFLRCVFLSSHRLSSPLVSFPSRYIYISVKVPPLPLPNAVPDLPPSHDRLFLFLFFFFTFLPALSQQCCPSLFLSPLISLQQLSENCLQCEMRQRRLASSIRV